MKIYVLKSEHKNKTAWELAADALDKHFGEKGKWRVRAKRFGDCHVEVCKWKSNKTTVNYNADCFYTTATWPNKMDNELLPLLEKVTGLKITDVREVKGA